MYWVLRKIHTYINNIMNVSLRYSFSNCVKIKCDYFIIFVKKMINIPQRALMLILITQ